MTDIVVNGRITFDPDVAGVTLEHAILLAGHLSIKDGRVVIDLLADYHVRCVRRGDVVGHSVYSRPVIDREKTPHWPEPEPQQGESI